MAVFGFIYHAVTETLFNDLTKKTNDEIEIDTPKIDLWRPEEVQIQQPIQPEQAPQQSQNDLGMSIIFDSNPNSDFLELHSSQDSVLSEIVIEKLTSSLPKQPLEKNEN